VSGSVAGRIWASPTGRIGALLTAVVLVLAVFAPWLATHDPNGIDVPARYAAPSLAHWMGTDHLGRDFFSRIVFGARIALVVALSVTALALALGTLLGVVAAYAPPAAERPILIVFDIVNSFPGVIFALVVIALLGPSLTNVIILVAVSFVPQFGRVARAQVLALKHSPFLEAERVLGASFARLVFFHVLPNILGPLVVLASMDVPVVITIEAGLSFLGVGVRPPLASWGTLLNDGFTHLTQSSWPVLFSGLALAVATLGFTLLGEALRDAADPKLRREP
jgi:peptide/nickel transport system permease protein